MNATPGRRKALGDRFLNELAAQDSVTPLYGRAAEQAALFHMVTQLAEGASGAAVIHGSPGSGRTRLLRRCVAFARVAGVQVMTAQGSASYAHASYALVRQLRSSRPVSGGTTRPAGPVEGSVQEGCRDLLTAAGRPTLLALDDVQWADPESVQVISTLLRRLASAPLAVLLTVIGARGELPDSCAELVDQAVGLHNGRGLLLELGPLGAPDVRDLCTTAGTPAPEPSDHSWWEEAAGLSDGNPWVLQRALGDLRQEPGEATETELRASFTRGIIAARAEQAGSWATKLPPEPLALLQGLTICRGLVPVDRVAALVGLDESRLPYTLRELRVQGLIDFVDPPRPRLTGCTSVLLADLDCAERKRLYAAAARSAHHCGADEAELATLLLATVPLGDPWVPWLLRRTARALLGKGRHTEAAELLERALREPLDAPERAEILLEAAEAYAVTAPEAADRRIAELLACPRSRPQVRAAAVDLLLTRGKPGTKVGETWALYEANDAEPPSAPQATGPHRPPHVPLRPQPDPEPPHGSPGPRRHPAVLAAAAWRQTLRGDSAASVEDLARQVLRAPADGALYPRFTACCSLAIAGMPTEARGELDAALAEAGRRRSPALSGLGLILRANLSLRIGDPDTADQDLAACRSLVPPPMWGPAQLTWLRATQIQLLVARERYEEADRLADEELPPGVRSSSPWIHLLYARAQLLLCQGSPRQALAEAEECGRRLAARGWDNPALLAWRSLAALAHVGCGDGDRAAALFAEELRLAERWGTDSAVGWTELRRGLASPAPQGARLTERALRRIGRTLISRRFAQAVVARETAGLHRDAQAVSAPPAPETRDGRIAAGP